MNVKTLSRLALLVVVLALAIAPGTAAAQTTPIKCTGTETMVQPPTGGTFEKHPSGNVQIRGASMMNQEESSSCPDDQLTGENLGTWNANLNAQGYGAMWGEFRSETASGGGVWVGTWHGSMSPGRCGYEAVGHGVAGSVAGLQFVLKADCSNGTWTATILDPGQ